MPPFHFAKPMTLRTHAQHESIKRLQVKTKKLLELRPCPATCDKSPRRHNIYTEDKDYAKNLWSDE